jgi:dienelactone hydrolase
MRGCAAGLAVLGAILVLAACGGEHKASGPVTLGATAATPLVDAIPEVRAGGLTPGSEVTLNATWRGFGGVRATSSERLRADAHGRLDLRGFDDLRFLWDMRVAPAKAFFTLPGTGDAPVDLALVSGGRTIARAVLHRRVGAAGVRVRVLTRDRDGLVGFFLAPAHAPKRRSAVMVLGGSEGGVSGVDLAALLASHGYPALALGYFGLPGLPSNLVHIPLEYFERGLRWLGRQPEADPRHLTVMGVSRGGEAALLSATRFPGLVHATIALVTSSEVLPGLPSGGAAWTYRGRPLGLDPIPVERARGAILVAGAGKDAVIPSSTYTAQIEERLTDHRFPYHHERLEFPQAGHDIGSAIPYLPQPDPFNFGGSPRAGALAKTQLWPKLLAFLRRYG